MRGFGYFRDNPAELMNSINAVTLLALRREPRSSWPHGWDIITKHHTVPDCNWQQHPEYVLQSLHECGDVQIALRRHYYNILAGLTTAGHIQAVPRDLRNIIYSCLSGELHHTYQGGCGSSFFLLGIEHTASAPSYIVINNKLHYAAWYNFGKRMRNNGPCTIRIRNTTLLTFSYNPHEAGEHLDCDLYCNMNREYCIQLEADQELPASVAEAIQKAKQQISLHRNE